MHQQKEPGGALQRLKATMLADQAKNRQRVSYPRHTVRRQRSDDYAPINSIQRWGHHVALPLCTLNNQTSFISFESGEPDFYCSGKMFLKWQKPPICGRFSFYFCSFFSFSFFFISSILHLAEMRTFELVFNQIWV